MPYRDRDKGSAFFTDEAMFQRLKGTDDKREKIYPGRCRECGVKVHGEDAAEEIREIIRSILEVLYNQSAIPFLAALDVLTIPHIGRRSRCFILTITAINKT